MPAFIPKQYKKEPITIRVSIEKLAEIDQRAAQYDMSRSEFINQCIDYAMEHIGEETE
ncbi:MAG: ribbon-helix-helix protein, CopG family [Ruminococcaceae bacterium]|nr:ribbon-helix-helix protein, CopG family [Oscillospiraceae bacterium]